MHHGANDRAPQKIDTTCNGPSPRSEAERETTLGERCPDSVECVIGNNDARGLDVHVA